MTDEELLERMLSWRGIDTALDNVCRDCDGSGVKTYGSTATWMGGIGGQMMTTGVCNKCWGSGATNRPGVNLRKLVAGASRGTVSPSVSRLSEDKKKPGSE